MEIYCFTPGCDCANKKQEAIFSVDVGDWFKPTNHNWVFCCVLPKKVDVLIGQVVMIQGHEYKIKAVELHAVANRELWQGRSIGMMIEGDRKDDEVDDEVRD